MKNKFGNNINVSEYFSSDFNDAISGQSVQNYDDKFFIYDPFGRSGEIIEDDGSGNKAIKFYQNEYSTVRISHLELLLPPISTHDKVLTFEYSIKFLGNTGRMRRSVIEGFKSNEPSDILSVTEAGEPDFELRALKQNGVQIATKDEFASNYVPMRVVIDAKNSTWTLYKKVNGEYSQVTKKTNAIIPEYIDKLHFEIIGEAGETNPRTYYIDDISVYSSEGLYLSDESGEKTTIQAGNNVFLKPEYLPGSDIGCVFAAIYNGEGKLVDIDKKAYLPNIQLGLNVPDDADNTYNIKYFEWKNINSMIPVNDAKVFNK